MVPKVQAMMEFHLLSPSEAMELDRLVQLDREQFLAQMPPGLARKATLAMELLEALQMLGEQPAPPGTTLH